jgi:hypothetical protein
MAKSLSSDQSTPEELLTEVQNYFKRKPEMYPALLSKDERELDTNTLHGKALLEFRNGGRPRPDNPDRPADGDPQSGKQKEQGVTIKSQTASTPKILSAETKLINPTKGELRIGGEFVVKYKYAINDPAHVQGGKRPEEYGKIVPSTKNGTLTDAFNLGLVGEPKVTVNRKKETIEVEKTERYVLNAATGDGDTSAINFKIVVEDPVNDKKVELRSTNEYRFGDNRPQYVPVRNLPKPQRGRQ